MHQFSPTGFFICGRYFFYYLVSKHRNARDHGQVQRHSLKRPLLADQRQHRSALRDATNALLIGTQDTGASLTLGDNVILKFWNSSINEYEYSTLNQGTGNYFTSLNDDSLLGDTWGDGASTPVKGDWLRRKPVQTRLFVCRPGQYFVCNKSVRLIERIIDTTAKLPADSRPGAIFSGEKV